MTDDTDHEGEAEAENSGDNADTQPDADKGGPAAARAEEQVDKEQREADSQRENGEDTENDN